MIYFNFLCLIVEKARSAGVTERTWDNPGTTVGLPCQLLIYKRHRGMVSLCDVIGNNRDNI